MSAPLQNTCRTWNKLDFFRGWGVGLFFVMFCFCFCCCFNLKMLVIVFLFLASSWCRNYVIDLGPHWTPPSVDSASSCTIWISLRWGQGDMLWVDLWFVILISLLLRVTSHELPRNRVRNSEEKVQKLLLFSRFGNWKWIIYVVINY